MLGTAPVSIAFSDAQVADLAHVLCGQLPTTRFVAELADAVGFQDSIHSMLGDARYPEPLLRALLLLTAFPSEGRGEDLIEATSRFDWPPKAIDRYFATWAALGVLERHPDSYRYRRVQAPAGGTNRGAEAGGAG